MRLMSFALTWDQMLAETKTVTRRLGWSSLKPGTIVRPVLKGQGIPKGGKVVRHPRAIRFGDVRREALGDMVRTWGYGVAECKREGFPDMTAREFVEMFAEYNHCDPDAIVNRIEFEFVDLPEGEA